MTNVLRIVLNLVLGFYLQRGDRVGGERDGSRSGGWRSRSWEDQGRNRMKEKNREVDKKRKSGDARGEL